MRQRRVQALGKLVGQGLRVLEARHLSKRVDAGVGAPGDRQLDDLAADPLDRGLDLALHSALARLRRPAANREPS